jgi:predicted lipid-binding transport protein (Tim44 family)
MTFRMENPIYPSDRVFVPPFEGIVMSATRLTTCALALAAGFALVTVDLAEARLGRGGSFGSRGTNTYKAPPQTNTAPKAAPIERSMTQKGAPTTTAQNTSSGGAATTQASRFGGWRGLLIGGLIAAGLASIFGFGALASVLGFVLQFALIAAAAYLVVAFLRNRKQPASVYAGAGGQRTPRPQVPRNIAMMSGAGASASTVAIGQADLDTFEKLLGDIQAAYGREDTDQLGAKVTPEMLSYFSQDLADNAKNGVRNEVTNVKLLQGDLSEAWRENGSEYATVAMRFSLTDAMVDRETGQVVSGDRSRPTEAIEFWTFRRDDRARDEGWQLSAIQQAA